MVSGHILSNALSKGQYWASKMNQKSSGGNTCKSMQPVGMKGDLPFIKSLCESGTLLCTLHTSHFLVTILFGKHFYLYFYGQRNGFREELTQNYTVGRRHRFQRQNFWVQILALTICMTWGKYLTSLLLSILSFKKRNNNNNTYCYGCHEH